jgi:hypothetical protein
MKKSTEENVVGNDGSHMKTILLDTEETKTGSQKATKQLRSKPDPEVPRKTMKKTKENRALKTEGVLGKLKCKDTAAGDLVSAQDPVTTELMQKTKRLKFSGSEEIGVHVQSETPTNSAGKEKKQREFANRAGRNQSLKDGVVAEAAKKETLVGLSASNRVGMVFEGVILRSQLEIDWHVDFSCILVCRV